MLFYFIHSTTLFIYYASVYLFLVHNNFFITLLLDPKQKVMVTKLYPDKNIQIYRKMTIYGHFVDIIYRFFILMQHFWEISFQLFYMYIRNHAIKLWYTEACYKMVPVYLCVSELS